MAVEIDVSYEGQLRCRAVHGPSGNVLLTDAPVDNHGKGEAFSPTDMVATALGACMLTIMGIVAERDNLDLTGTKVRVVKEMAQQPKRRIGKLTLAFSLPENHNFTDRDLAKLKRAAEHCPVHACIHPDIELDITFS